MLSGTKVASATDAYRKREGESQSRTREWVIKEKDGHSIPRPPIRLARSIGGQVHLLWLHFLGVEYVGGYGEVQVGLI